MKKTDTNTVAEKSAFDFVHTIKGIVISYFISVVLLLIFSIIAVYSCFGTNAVNIGVNIVTALSLIICGFISARGVKCAGLVNGAFSGVLYTLILYIIGSIINMQCEFTMSTLTVFVMGLICGAFGGIIGINTSRRRR